MNSAVALLVLLVGSVVERSDAFSCYDCGYHSGIPDAATCDITINATSVPKCNGLTCEWNFQNVTGGPNKFYTFRRGCSNETKPYQVDQCLTYNTEAMKNYNQTFFNYRSSCCYKLSSVLEDRITPVLSIICICQEDDCNGDQPTDYNQTNAGFLVKPSSKLSIGVVAMITASSLLPKIMWFISTQ